MIGRDLDRAVLRQLEAAGANLELPTHTICYFYFPTEHAARAAGKELANEGWRVDVHPAPASWWKRLLGKREWSCIVDQVATLEEQAVIDRTDRFNALAARLGGEYDGFEAAVTKEPNESPTDR